MQAPKFELNKIRRLIRVQGVQYTFYQDELNDFNEPTGGTSAITVQGIFHQTTSHVTVVASNASSVQTKPSPYILTLYTEAEGIRQGDYLTIDGTRYKVNGLTDVNNWHIATDISLEVVV